MSRAAGNPGNRLLRPFLSRSAYDGKMQYVRMEAHRQEMGYWGRILHGRHVICQQTVPQCWQGVDLPESSGSRQP